MIPILDYFYYKMFKFALFLKLDDSQFSALTGVTLIEFITVIIVKKIFDLSISINKPKAWLLAIIVLAINYFIFLRRKRYLKIKERYDKEPKWQKIIGSICVIFYILLSFFGLFAYHMY